MPRIPIEDQRPMVSGLPGAPQASADMFGAATGRAISSAGDALLDVNRAAGQYRDKVDRVAAAEAHATLMRDFSGRYIQMEQQAPEGKTGFGDTVAAEFDKYAEERTGSLSDGARAHLRQQLADSRLRFAVRASEAEAHSTAAMVKDKAMTAMTAHLSTIALDPRGSVDAADTAAMKLLDETPMSGDARAALARTWRYKAADAYFQSLISRSKTPEEFAGLRKEMASDKWKDRIDPKDVVNLQSHLTHAERSAMAEADQRAGAAIQSVRERLNAGADVPPGETAAVERLVGQSRNPVHAAAFAELRITQQTRQQAARLGPAELQAEHDRLMKGRTTPDVPEAQRAQTMADLTKAIGRPATEPELYVAQTVGVDKATTLFKAAASTPDAPLESVLPGVGKPGQTVMSYLGETMKGYATGVSRVDMVRAKAVAAQLEEVRKATAAGGDIMSYDAKGGRVVLQDLVSDEAAAIRGQQALETARRYGLPMARPLTAQEVTRLSGTLTDAPPQQATAVIRQLAAMGPEAAKGAFAQLGDKHPWIGHVAGLSMTGPAGMAVAEDVIRGHRRLTEDKAGAKSRFGDLPQGTQPEFERTVGTALDGLKPDARRAIREAADALYVERTPSGARGFDPKVYAGAVNDVLGGKDVLTTINGRATVLPRGIDKKTMTTALDQMTPDDLARLSTNGRPPVNLFGDPVRPRAIAQEAELRPLGGGEYLVLMADGRPLAAGKDSAGRPVPYVMRLAAGEVQSIAARKPADVPLTPEVAADAQIAELTGRRPPDTSQDPWNLWAPR